jgi:hypothetical protein
VSVYGPGAGPVPATSSSYDCVTWRIRRMASVPALPSVYVLCLLCLRYPAYTSYGFLACVTRRIRLMSSVPALPGVYALWFPCLRYPAYTSYVFLPAYTAALRLLPRSPLFRSRPRDLRSPLSLHFEKEGISYRVGRRKGRKKKVSDRRRKINRRIFRKRPGAEPVPAARM